MSGVVLKLSGKVQVVGMSKVYKEQGWPWVDHC